MTPEDFCLQSLRVRGYKVLKDFSLDNVGPLNVIVGPNGCGKSALWEVITLFPELARGPQSIFDIETFLYMVFYPHRSQMGFQGVVHPQAKRVEIDLGLRSGEQLYTYKLILEPESSPSSPGVDTVLEKLTIQERELLSYDGRRDYEAEGHPKLYKTHVKGQGIEVRWPHYHPLLLLNAPNDELSTDSLFRGLREYFKSWRGFKPVFTHLLAKGGQNLDARLITPGERFSGEWLDTPMCNLPQVLLRLKKHNETVFKEIEEIFLVAMDCDPDTHRIYVEEESHQIRVLLDGVSWPSRRYWLADWPDGWKAFLSWLVALRTTPPGAVICLEEPENNLYPRLLAQLLEQIEIANGKGVQVFASTHSMELVNSIKAQELILIKDGRAYRLDHEKADKIREAGMLLGSTWVEGFLEDMVQPPVTSPQ